MKIFALKTIARQYGIPLCDLCGCPIKVTDHCQQIVDGKGPMSMHLACVTMLVRRVSDAQDERDLGGFCIGPDGECRVNPSNLADVVVEQYVDAHNDARKHPLPPPQPFGDRPVVRQYTKEELPHGPEDGYDDPKGDDGTLLFGYPPPLPVCKVKCPACGSSVDPRLCPGLKKGVKCSWCGALTRNNNRCHHINRETDGCDCHLGICSDCEEKATVHSVPCEHKGTTRWQWSGVYCPSHIEEARKRAAERPRPVKEDEGDDQ